MRIAIVIERFDPKRGGAETYTAGLVQSLIADGHDVSVVAANWAVEPAKATMVRVPVKGMTAAGRALSFATEASELVSGGEYDVVHSMARIVRLSVFQPHGGVMRASIEQSLASSRSGLQRGLRRAARWLNTKSDMLVELETIIYEENPPPRFVAVSGMVADDMKRYYNIPDSKIDVVYNGVDVERFRPENRNTYMDDVRRELDIDPEDVLVLLVAHNYRLKGVDIFLRTIAELARRGGKNVRGLIIGGGDDTLYSSLARKLGLADRVVFHGAADHMERYYAAADIYLHPTFYDPMSLVVLEALASGLPVITTGMNGASEIITEGVDGFVVDGPRNVPAILSCLEKLMEPSLRADVSAAARVLAEKFPLERNYAGIMEVYSKAVADGDRPDILIRKGE